MTTASIMSWRYDPSREEKGRTMFLLRIRQIHFLPNQKNCKKLEILRDIIDFEVIEQKCQNDLTEWA